MINRGTSPVLMRTGKLTVTLKNISSQKMALYALGFDGARREELPMRVENDTLHINLNTAVLKNGPTPFFELASSHGSR
jgi:hypothetical protein